MRLIAEIGDYYAGNIGNFILKEVIKEPPIIRKRTRDIGFKNRDFLDKIMRILYDMLRTLYAGFYFYFMPFTVIVFSYILGEVDESAGKTVTGY